MSVVNQHVPEAEGDEGHSIARRLERYLNSSLGWMIMNHLEDGESFVLRVERERVRVTKRNGRAIVEVLG